MTVPKQGKCLGYFLEKKGGETREARVFKHS